MASAGTPDRRPLAERYRPTRLEEVVGQPRAVAELTSWASAWDGASHPARRAALLVGPAGVGKTSAAVALAEERGWALVEMNASEARNQGAIERVAGRASITHSLDALAPGRRTPGRTLILLDEADCLSGGRTSEGSKPVKELPTLRSFLEGRYGRIEALNEAWGLAPGSRTRPFESWASLPKSPGTSSWAKLPVARRDLEEWRAAGKTEETGDRGGMAALARLVRSTLQPMVLTVNDDRPLVRYSPAFRTSVRTIEFGPVPFGAVERRVREVARREGIGLAPGVAEAIGARARGDLRAALNDLEAIAVLPPGRSPLESLGTRDLAGDFASLTETVLTRPRYYRSAEVRDLLDAPPDDLLPWVEENVPWFAPDAVHRDAAFHVVAAADALLTRARRWRTYGLWSYASELLTGGVSLAIRDEPSSSGGHAAFPRFLGEMGRSRASRAVRDGIVRKLGRRTHVSRAKSRAIGLPFLETLVHRSATGRPSSPERALARALARELELSNEEVAALLGVEPDSALVRSIVPQPEDDGIATGDAEGGAPEPSAGSERASGRPTVQRRLVD